MTPRALSEFRARFPACELVVYVDISAGTVLKTDGALNYPQEILDALRDCARDLLNVRSEFMDQAVEHAVLLGQNGARIFLRAPDEPSEALCCLCAPEIDVDPFLDAARAAISTTDAAT